MMVNIIQSAMATPLHSLAAALQMKNMVSPLIHQPKTPHPNMPARLITTISMRQNSPLVTKSQVSPNISKAAIPPTRPAPPPKLAL